MYAQLHGNTIFVTLDVNNNSRWVGRLPPS